MAAVSKRCIEYMGEICKKSIYVKNIPENVSYSHVYEEFKKFGNVVNITLPVVLNTNQPKGYAFIEYLNEDDAANALLTLNGSRLWGRVLAISYSRGRPKSAREMAMRNALRAVKLKKSLEQPQSTSGIQQNPSNISDKHNLPPDEDSNGVSDIKSRVSSSGSHRSRSSSDRSRSSSSSSYSSTSSSGSSTSSSSSSSNSSGCSRSRSPRKRSTSSSSSDASMSRRRRRCTRHRRSRHCRRSGHHRHRCSRGSKAAAAPGGGGGSTSGSKGNAANDSVDCIPQSDRCLHSSLKFANLSYQIVCRLSNRLWDTPYSAANRHTRNVRSANLAVQLKEAPVSVRDRPLCSLLSPEPAVFHSFPLTYSLRGAKEASKNMHHMNRLTRFYHQNSLGAINMPAKISSALTGDKVQHRAADLFTASLAQVPKELMGLVAAVSSQQHSCPNAAVLVILRCLASGAYFESWRSGCSVPRSSLGLQRHRRELAQMHGCSYSLTNRQTHLLSFYPCSTAMTVI